MHQPAKIMKLFDDLRQQAEDLRLLLSGAKNIHYFSSHGNMGDELIYAGTRQLLARAEIPYIETKLANFTTEAGEVALISGGGAWCRTWDGFMPDILPKIKERFDRVIVLPSSYQLTERVLRAVETPEVIFMAREKVSYSLMKDHCNVRLAHDHAFHFNYGMPYPIKGSGTLYAYRRDAESAGLTGIPIENIDISLQCTTLMDWLITIDRYETIYTDRAHVLIAAAMMGKKVFWWESNYHKIPAIVLFSLSEFENVKYMGKENPIKE